jgi:hypothetical protein
MYTPTKDMVRERQSDLLAQAQRAQAVRAMRPDRTSPMLTRRLASLLARMARRLDPMVGIPARADAAAVPAA